MPRSVPTKMLSKCLRNCTLSALSLQKNGSRIIKQFLAKFPENKRAAKLGITVFDLRMPL